MKLSAVLHKSLQLYKANWFDLMKTLLLELLLRALCLTPLMFLASDMLWPLAWLCVPAYVLIALPARQNYAQGLQRMLRGESVFSWELLSCRDYGAKLSRGLKGMALMLLWAALPITGLLALWAMYNGLVDFITMFHLLQTLGSGDTVTGIVRAVIIVLVLMLFIPVGCAFHSGTRHAAALGDSRLVRGHRGKLMLLWLSGLVTLVPFVAVSAFTLGEYVLLIASQLKDFMSGGFNLPSIGTRLYVLAGAAVVLLLPLLPLKNMLPAVYLHMARESTYMRRGEETDTNAAA